MSIKFLVLGGGYFGFLGGGGGGSADSIFMGARIFLRQPEKTQRQKRDSIQKNLHAHKNKIGAATPPSKKPRPPPP